MAQPVSATAQALGVPELLLEVLSYLGQADLAGAARVSKYWLEETQPLLYAAPEVVGPDEGYDWGTVCETMGALITTLDERPELAKYVTELELVTEGHVISLDKVVTIFGTKWFKRLLMVTPNLTRLDLHGELEPWPGLGRRRSGD